MKNKNKSVHGENWASIYILGVVSFFNDMASEMIYPLIPVFIKSVLGLGASFIGIVEGVAESANSILKLFSGWISDKAKKRKIFVLAGYGLSNIIRPLIGIADSWGFLLAFRFSDRVGKGIRTSPRDAMICDLAPEGRRGYAFGFQRAMDHAGAVFGPLIAGLLMSVFLLDIKKIFLLSYIPGIIVILLIFFGVKEAKNSKLKETECLDALYQKEEMALQPEAKKQKGPLLNLHDFKKLGPRFNYFLIILIIFALGNSTDAFLLLRASDLGIKTAYIPVLWAALHASKVLFSIIGGHFSDKSGRKILIITGWGVYFLTYFGFAYADRSWQIWALFLFYGMFFGFTEGAEKALVGDMIGRENRGLAYGFYNLAIGISALPASLIFGFVWKAAGFKAAFIMGSLLALAALIMMIFLKTPKIDSNSYFKKIIQLHNNYLDYPKVKFETVIDLVMSIFEGCKYY
ncbi:MAG: MFS transporter [Candidatus Humimicrobiaceae bacterium]